MLGFWRKPPFDSDTLSSIWVMACRDELPVVTAFSIAFRLGGGITPDQVMELVKGRRELFRLGLTPAQSRAWKERYRWFADGGPEPAPKPQPKKPDQKDKAQEGDKEGEKEQRPYSLPDWLRVFDDEGPQADQDRVRKWLGGEGITSSKQAVERFLDKGFVIDECVLRSVFRLEPGLDAPPSDLPTVNWGLEHLDRLRRGRAETRQSLVALTTGIGGVAIGAFVALTAPMVTTIYQGRRSTRTGSLSTTRRSSSATVPSPVPRRRRRVRRGPATARRSGRRWRRSTGRRRRSCRSFPTRPRATACGTGGRAWPPRARRPASREGIPRPPRAVRARSRTSSACSTARSPMW